MNSAYNLLVLLKADIIIISLNVTCSHHDIAASLLIWRYIASIHSIVIPVIGNSWQHTNHYATDAVRNDNGRDCYYYC
jgi:hypothetical protein